MLKLGYRDGSNIVLDFRWGNNDHGRLPELATDLVKLRVNIIVAENSPAVIAARSVTSEVAIISPLMADPVGSGFAQSLAHPSGNVTGLSTLSAHLSAKRLELLSEIVPSLARAGMLWDQNIQSFGLTVRQIEVAAQSLGVSMQVRGVRSSDDLAEALTAIESDRAQALVVAIPAGSTVHGGHLDSLVAAVSAHHLPAAYTEVAFVNAGGLISYGPKYADLFRRAAHYVDRILKGARPGDLPVEQPILFELGINLRTAKALGVVIPQFVLMQADQVIE